MGLFGSIVGATVGGLFGLAQQSSSNSAAASMQNTSIEANRETMQNKHQWEVADLKKAGLNPMISAMNSSGTLSASSGSAGAAPSAAAGAAAMAQAFSAAKLNQSQIDVNKTQAEKNLAEARATTDMVDISRNNSASQIDLQSKQGASIELQNEYQKLSNMRESEWSKYYPKLAENGFKKGAIENVLLLAQIDKIDADIGIGWSLASTARQNAEINSRNADTNSRNAAVAELVGASQAQVNYVTSAKGRHEIRETIQKVERLTQENSVYSFDNSLKLGRSTRNNPIGGLSVGRQIADEIPVLGSVLRMFR